MVNISIAHNFKFTLTPFTPFTTLPFTMDIIIITELLVIARA